jgi:hypothetical protein
MSSGVVINKTSTKEKAARCRAALKFVLGNQFRTARVILPSVSTWNLLPLKNPGSYAAEILLQ